MEEGAGLGFGERVEDLLSSDWAIGVESVWPVLAENIA